MDELINQIASRTGISQDQARQAVEMAVSFIRTKLPEPLASQIDGFLAGGDPADLLSQMQEQLGNLGGFLGQK
jgi:hypothetical protein